MDFICLDVETANESAASICQVGLAHFSEGVHRPELDVEVLVDPEDYFLPELTALHGLSERDVLGAPTFRQLYSSLAESVNGRCVLAHSPFDRVSLRQATQKYRLPELSPRWLDTLRVARRAWPDRMHREGHRLIDLAGMCNVKFEHHSALQDAWCAGQVFLNACAKSSLGLEDWYRRVEEPIGLRPDLTPSKEGVLIGERIVFTGKLSITRQEASVKAAQIGCEVDEGVTKHTTIVVVGMQDVTKLAGREISNKHQKALDWIAKGKRIKMLNEADFDRLTQIF